MAVEHPGVGELGRANSYHVHNAANEIPEGAEITFALVGNQNCGKFSGVTVNRKDGIIRKL